MKNFNDNINTINLEEESSLDQPENIKNNKKVQKKTPTSFINKIINPVSKIVQYLKNIMSKKIEIENEDVYNHNLYNQILKRFNKKEELSLNDSPSLMAESNMDNNKKNQSLKKIPQYEINKEQNDRSKYDNKSNLINRKRARDGQLENNFENEYKNKKEEKETKKEKSTEQLSQSINNIFLINKDFSAPVEIKKDNKLFTDFHYATFNNSYGENTCYINVILHLLYNIKQLEEFIVSLYEIDEFDKNNPEETNDEYKFLVLIGKILFEYKEIIFNNEDITSKAKNNKQVHIIKTLEMRKMLEKVSKNKFPLDTIADPVEFFSFVLDILNKHLNEDVHKTFYLELIDEYTCNKKGCSQIYNKYDKDNFIYHIYIDEILKYIEKENIKVNDYKNKLFKFCHDLFLSENIKICEKCKEKMNHNLICNNLPDYILINCVWKESNPIVDDAMTIFFMMPIKDEINNLFIIQKNAYKKKLYHLFGFILYSFTLSHFIICIYNTNKNVFVLLNDEIVKEFHNIYELLIDISVEEIKARGKAFFYPVMLIYTKDIIYNNQYFKINTLNDSEYRNIINKCNEAIYQYEMKNNINEEIEENIKQFNFKTFLKEPKNNKKKEKEIEDNIIKDINNYQSKIKEEISEEKNILKEDMKIELNQENLLTRGKTSKNIKDQKGNNLSNILYLGDKSNPNLDIRNKNKDTKKGDNYSHQSNIESNSRINNRKKLKSKI